MSEEAAPEQCEGSLDGHPVSHAEIYRRAFGSSYSAQDARRTSYHIDKQRPRLSPFGLTVRTIIDHGYILLAEPREQ